MADERDGGLGGLRIGFLGGGAMAEALVAGLRAAGVAAQDVRVGEPVAARRSLLAERHGVEAVQDNAAVAGASQVVVLAVKPALAEPVLAEVAAHREGRLWISIATGVPLARLEEALGGPARLVRAVPNTPALVRAGATAFRAGAACDADDVARTRALLATVGTTWEAPSEALLDAATGLAGSGPAYVFLFLEALADAGVRVGLPRAAAQELACQTVLGAARLVAETGRHPAELKDQVTSPGGTTIAGLERLEAGGVRAAVYEAVAAAEARARELGGRKG